MRARRGVKRSLEPPGPVNDVSEEDKSEERGERGEGPPGTERWDVLSTTDLKRGTRDAFGRLYSLLPRYGLSKGDFRRLLEDAHFDIPESTLQRISRKVMQEGSAYKKVKLSGAEFKLSPKEQRVVVGFVLDGNLRKVLVTGKVILEFIEAQLGHKLSAPTITRLMQRSGMSRQAVVKRKNTYCLDKAKMVSIYHEWLVKQKTGVLANKKPSQICSIDFTYLSHRTTRLSGYAAVGR